MLVFHHKPKISIIINTILMLLWTIYFIRIKPAENSFMNLA